MPRKEKITKAKIAKELKLVTELPQDRARCDVCRKEFKNRKSAIRHALQQHAPIKEYYLCGECPFRDLRKTDCVQHCQNMHEEFPDAYKRITTDFQDLAGKSYAALKAKIAKPLCQNEYEQFYHALKSVPLTVKPSKRKRTDNPPNAVQKVRPIENNQASTERAPTSPVKVDTKTSKKSKQTITVHPRVERYDPEHPEIYKTPPKVTFEGQDPRERKAHAPSARPKTNEAKKQNIPKKQKSAPKKETARAEYEPLPGPSNETTPPRINMETLEEEISDEPRGSLKSRASPTWNTERNNVTKYNNEEDTDLSSDEEEETKSNLSSASTVLMDEGAKNEVEYEEDSSEGEASSSEEEEDDDDTESSDDDNDIMNNDIMNILESLKTTLKTKKAEKSKNKVQDIRIEIKITVPGFEPVIIEDLKVLKKIQRKK